MDGYKGLHKYTHCINIICLNAASVGEGHLKARSDGGDCNVDPTEAAGTGRLKSAPSRGLARIQHYGLTISDSVCPVKNA